jgi:hypothetical protein
VSSGVGPSHPLQDTIGSGELERELGGEPCGLVPPQDFVGTAGAVEGG